MRVLSSQMFKYFFVVHIASCSQQRDRVHYLLETGYPVLPVMPTPLIQPAPESQYFDDEQPYEDMEGVLSIYGLAWRKSNKLYELVSSSPVGCFSH